MKCEICKRSAPKHGISLFRVNPVGKKGVWRCREHLTPMQALNVDPETQRLVRLFESGEATVC